MQLITKYIISDDEKPMNDCFRVIYLQDHFRKRLRKHLPIFTEMCTTHFLTQSTDKRDQLCCAFYALVHCNHLLFFIYSFRIISLCFRF